MATVPFIGIATAGEDKATEEIPDEVVTDSKRSHNTVKGDYVLRYGPNFLAGVGGEKSGCNGDDCTSFVNFPRPITFYGNTHSGAYFGSNGCILTYGSSCSYGDSPYMMRFYGGMWGLWDDLHTGCSDTEGWFLKDLGGVQSFEYRGHAYGQNDCNTVSFEVMVYDNGLIRYGYGDNTNSVSDSTTGIDRAYCGYYDYYWYDKCPFWSTYYENRDNAETIFFAPSACTSDNTAPVADVALTGTIGNNGWYKAGPVTVNVDATDPSGTDAWGSLDGTESARFTAPLVSAVDGTHALDVLAWDLCGNSDETRSFTWKQDATAPATAYDVSGPSFENDGVWYVVSDTTLSLSATDATSGVAGITYAIEGGDYDGTPTPYTGEISLEGADGAYTLTYWAEDAAGNVEAAKTLDIVLDNAAPIVDITKPVPGTIESGELVQATGVSHSAIGWRYVQVAADIEDVSPVTAEFRVDGEVIAFLENGPWEITWDNREWLPGEHVIEVVSTDILGNEGSDETTIVLLPGMTTEDVLEAIWG